jgi:hypothetical protein
MRKQRGEWELRMTFTGLLKKNKRFKNRMNGSFPRRKEKQVKAKISQKRFTVCSAHSRRRGQEMTNYRRNESNFYIEMKGSQRRGKFPTKQKESIIVSIG